MNRDQLYKSLDRTDYLSVTHLSKTFQVASVQVHVEYNITKHGTFRNGTVSAEELSEIFRSVRNQLQEKSASIFLQGFCFAIFFRYLSCYIFDSQSRNSVGFEITS